MHAEGKCDLAGHFCYVGCVLDKLCINPLHNLYQNEVQCVRHLVLKTHVLCHCCSEAQLQVCLLICIGVTHCRAFFCSCMFVCQTHNIVMQASTNRGPSYTANAG